MKYRLRKLIDKHNPNNQKYTDFKLLGGDEEKARNSDSDDEYTCVRWSKRHPVGRMKIHADFALSQEFRRCTDTLPFQPASPSVIQSLQRASEAEFRKELMEVKDSTLAAPEALPEKVSVKTEEKIVEVEQPQAPVEQEIVLENSDSDSEYEADTGGIEDVEEKEDAPKDPIEKEIVGEEKSASSDSAIELAGELVSDTIKTASEIISQDSAANLPQTKELPTEVPANTPLPQEQPTEASVENTISQELPADASVPQKSSNEATDDPAETKASSTEVADEKTGQIAETGGKEEEEVTKRTVVEHSVEIPGPGLDSSTEEERSQEIKSILKGSSDADGLSNKSVKFSG